MDEIDHYADDENGEGDEEEEEEEEDDDDDDEEPRLKYQRMGGSVPDLLSADTASCITVAERMIALGTHGGTVHLLDYQGNQVREYTSHSATVNEVSFDVAGEYVGSCSDDGSVVVNSLYADVAERFEYRRPMKALALDPDYSKSQRFAVGGLAGQLILNTKGWFGSRDLILHSGEGSIHAVKWRTNLIAWANDEGVKIFDTASHQRLSFIEKPRGVKAEHRPHLVWQDDTLLLIGWGNYIKIASVKIRGSSTVGTSDVFGFGKKFPLVPGTKYVEIKAELQTENYICGIAPYGESLVVLEYIADKEDDTTDLANNYQTGHAHRPEVCILTWKNEELSSDALSIHGYEHYKAKDYALTHAPFSGSSSAGGQWAAGDEPLYYIVSPKDVVIARSRDTEDHVAWLLEHGWHEKALAAVESSKAGPELLDEVGTRYLDHLILERQYAQAAALCPKLLRGSAPAWERWVFHFAHLRQLHVLSPYVPTADPKLRETIYEVVLHALITNPTHHPQLLTTIRLWPHNLYSVPTVISAVELQSTTVGKSPYLQEALAELYLIERLYENVLQIYLELEKPYVFSFIEEHNLYDSLHDEKIQQLVRLDGRKTVALLIQQRSKISAAEVVSQLKRVCPDDNQLLHDYLHALFEKDSNAGRDFHGLQVELYAQYEPRLLLPFLRSSHYYSLDEALGVCSKRGLTKERVFILGRMGNCRDALAIIIDEMKDMQEAIEFVVSYGDEDLWQDLIKQSLRSPEMIGALLDNNVGNVDPLDFIRKIPFGMKIPCLRNRLVKIITDYRTQTSLCEGCNNILKADRRNLQRKFYNEARRVMRVGTCRCCICSAPFLQSDEIRIFFCGHAHHATCSDADAINKYGDGDGDGDDDDDDDDGEDDEHDGKKRKRCILCTTKGSHQDIKPNGFV